MAPGSVFGLLDKRLVAFLLGAIVVGVAVTPRTRHHLRSPWAWATALLAVGFFVTGGKAYCLLGAMPVLPVQTDADAGLTSIGEDQAEMIGGPVLVCDGPRGTWAQAWEHVRHPSA